MEQLPSPPSVSDGMQCDVCGQYGAYEMGDQHLCGACCHTRGSCCNEQEDDN